MAQAHPGFERRREREDRAQRLLDGSGFMPDRPSERRELTLDLSQARVILEPSVRLEQVGERRESRSEQADGFPEEHLLAVVHERPTVARIRSRRLRL